MLNLSALFLSQKRLDEVLNRELLPFAYSRFTLNDRRNSDLEKTAVIGAYEDAALEWLSSARFPTLGELIAEGRLALGLFFTHLGAFWGKGIVDAATQFETGRPIKKEAILWTKLDGFRKGLTLTIQVHPENYTTSSAPGEMSGKNRLFLVGRLTDCEADGLRAQAYIIGHLHEEKRRGKPSVDHFGRLPRHMEVFPDLVEDFSASRDEKMPRISELKQLLTIPEAEIKATFASIIGEPFVPKDWGGEQSDLVSTQVRIEGQRVATAFAFKGPSAGATLTVAGLGKNGDQIARLFSEPSDFVVLQCSSKISSAVRDHMRAFATRIGRLRPFCIIDGAATVRILKAYEKLGFTSTKQDPPAYRDLE